MKKWLAGTCCLFLVPTFAIATQTKPAGRKANPTKRVQAILPAVHKTKPIVRKATPTTRKAAPTTHKTPLKKRSAANKTANTQPLAPLYNTDSPIYRAPPAHTSLGQILTNQAIRVCVRTDVPPFGYFSNTGLTGFDIDLAKEIAIQLSIFYKKNLLISWVGINAGARITSLQQNHCDMVVAAFSYTASRAKLVAFTKRYLKTNKVIVSNANITRKRPVIALVRGTTNSAKGLKGTIKYYNNYKEIIFAMENGQVDYIVTDRPIALHMIRSVTKSFTIIKALPKSEVYAIGINKNNSSLLKAINRALRILGKSGRLAYLYRQWL